MNLSIRLFFIFFLTIRRPPRSTRTDTLFPYTTLFRSMASKSNSDDFLAMLGRREIPKSRRLALREPPYDEGAAAVVGNTAFKGLSPINLRMSLAHQIGRAHV